MLPGETHRPPVAELALVDSLELFEGNLMSHCYHLLSVLDFEKPFSADSENPSLNCLLPVDPLSSLLSSTKQEKAIVKGEIGLLGLFTTRKDLVT